MKANPIARPPYIMWRFGIIVDLQETQQNTDKQALYTTFYIQVGLTIASWHIKWGAIMPAIVQHGSACIQSEVSFLRPRLLTGIAIPITSLRCQLPSLGKTCSSGQSMCRCPARHIICTESQARRKLRKDQAGWSQTGWFQPAVLPNQQDPACLEDMPDHSLNSPCKAH